MITFAYILCRTNKTDNMTLIESIIARAKSNKQRIVLPESLEERTLTAADKSLADDIADIILIGNPCRQAGSQEYRQGDHHRSGYKRKDK